MMEIVATLRQVANDGARQIQARVARSVNDPTSDHPRRMISRARPGWSRTASR
jgi:hypothetical protein